MPKIERKTQKIFGGNADSDQLAVFGSMITGTPVYNDDIETLQSEAYTEGWQVAVAANEAPFMEEMNGVQYGFSKQLAYLFQQGIAEWDSGTTYYLNSFCQVGGVIYKSMQDENINHSPADDTEGTYWSPLETGGGGSSGLEVGDIGMALYIDETKGLRRRLNGTTVSVNTNTQAFVNKLKSIVALYPSLACTETEWAELEDASDVGQVGKFVIQDTEEIPYYAYSSDSTVYYTKSTEDAESVEVYDSEFTLQGQGSISQGVLTYNSSVYNRASESDITQEISGYVRLPKIIMPIQGLSDLTKLGEYSQAGLPNITGRFCNWAQNGRGVVQEGALFGNGTTGAGGQSSGSNNTILNLDASRSSAIYGKSTTVQQEQIQYPYFIQIATGQETEANITNEIELNNPFTLFDSKYSEVPLYNVSWLKSDGEYKPKATYVTCYEALVVEQNSAVEAGTSVQLPSGSTYVKRGLSVKLSTAEDITDYDFVINTTEETFRLPLLDGSEDLPGSESVLITANYTTGQQIVAPYNGIYAIHTNYNANIQYTNYSLGGGSEKASLVQNSLGSVNGQTSIEGIHLKRGQSLTIGTISTTSVAKPIYCFKDTGNGSLYYYVGETIQNANLIDAGRIGEQLANKVDMLQASGAGMPSDKYIDLTLGASGAEYVAPANGYVLIRKNSTAAGQNVHIFSVNPVTQASICWCAGVNQEVDAGIEVQKGQKFTCYYSAGGALLQFRFVYAEGSKED